MKNFITRYNTMRLLLIVGLCVLLFANITRANDISVFDAEDEEIALLRGGFYDDANGNVMPLEEDAGEDEESLEESENELPNRVFFHLYTRSNPDQSQQIYIGDTKTLENSNWDVARPTRIITHGWFASREGGACVLIREGYLKQGDYNVIVVDWSKIAKGLYTYASYRVKQVAGYVSKMINFLETEGMDLSGTVLVGHSLGAHIMGIAARNAENTVGYVVGLDPALPLFWFSGPGDRIAKGDAGFVQIIHTSAGSLGFSSAIGDIDFYPNGGSDMRGCIIDVFGSCSHLRSFKYFAESLTSDVGFYGKKCSSSWKYALGLCKKKPTAPMGGSVLTTTNQSGSYYLKTSRWSPYAEGL